jgi:Pel9A-like, right handed beta helix region
LARLQLARLNLSRLQGAGSFAAALLVCLCWAQPSRAATYYVDPGGSDASAGSANAPFQTIQKAAGVVRPGDTVIVRDGVYTGDAVRVAEIDRSGTATQWITFRAENQWGAIVDGRDASTAHGIILREDAGYIRIEGLQIQGTREGGISASAGTHDVYYYRNLIHDIGRICTDTTGGQVGFRDRPDSVRMTYDSNVLHTIGRLHPSDGCSYATSNYKNHDHGLYLWGHDLTIVNNVFYDFPSGWAIQSADGASDWLIANNTFAFANPDREGQIVLWDRNTNFTIANNIFYQPLRAAIYVLPCQNKTNVVARNNISTAEMLFDEASGRLQCARITLTGNSTFLDPQLADPGGLDFRLRAASPAIDSADASFSAAFDQDGTPRPQRDGYDIGAFEFGPPVITFAVEPRRVAAGQAARLTWSSRNATGCVGSGAWSGDQPVAGSAMIEPRTKQRYTLLCTGEGGAAAQTVTVSVMGGAAAEP